jgi:predicted phosphodiesterase
MSLQLALVGDLSNQPSDRLAKVLDAALAGNAELNPVVPGADLVVQLGDLSAAYDAVRARLASGKLMVVKGNHDDRFAELGTPLNWRMEVRNLVTLIGVDNSTDVISPEGWALLEEPSKTPFTFVFAHKSPMPLVLPDGSESRHIMGEGQSCPDADRLVELLRTHADAMAVGHFHGWTLQFTPHGVPLICEGRGGAAPSLGYSLINVLPEGWVMHSVDVPS